MFHFKLFSLYLVGGLNEAKFGLSILKKCNVQSIYEVNYFFINFLIKVFVRLLKSCYVYN